jgi:hypothetical protein
MQRSAISPREGQWCTDSCRSASINAEAVKTPMAVDHFLLHQVRRSWARGSVAGLAAKPSHQPSLRFNHHDLNSTVQFYTVG